MLLGGSIFAVGSASRRESDWILVQVCVEAPGSPPRLASAAQAAAAAAAASAAAAAAGPLKAKMVSYKLQFAPSVSSQPP